MRRLYWMIIPLGLLLVAAVLGCASEQGTVVREERRLPPSTDIYTRIESQQKSIDEGAASGRFTFRETQILQDNLNWIKSRYAKLIADRLLTWKEQTALDQMLGENQLMITGKSVIGRVYETSPVTAPAFRAF